MPTVTPEWIPPQPWANPDGKVILPYNAPRAKWLQARVAGLGSSDVPIIMGVRRFGNTPYKVWTQKMGIDPADSWDQTNRAQRRGMLFEEPVIRLWAEHDVDFPFQFRRQGLVQSKKYPWLLASVDFPSVCPLGRCITEVKTMNDPREWDDGAVPLGYVWQGLVQRIATGRDHVHFLGMGARFKIEHRILHAEPDLEAKLVERTGEWWQRHVKDGEPPPVEGDDKDYLAEMFYLTESGKSMELPDHLVGAYQRINDLKDTIAPLQVEVDTITAQLRLAAQDAESITLDGVEVATYKPTKKLVGFDAKYRKAHAAALADYEVPSTEYAIDKYVADHPEEIETGALRYQRNWNWVKKAFEDD